MKKFILDLIVKENKTLNSQYFLLILTSKEQLPEMLPGQFVEVRVDNAPTTFLRRPISINYVDYIRDALCLMWQMGGEGTTNKSTVEHGEVVCFIVPLFKKVIL